MRKASLGSSALVGLPYISFTGTVKHTLKNMFAKAFPELMKAEYNS